MKAVSFGYAGQGSAIMRGPMVSGGDPEPDPDPTLTLTLTRRRRVLMHAAAISMKFTGAASSTFAC